MLRDKATGEAIQKKDTSSGKYWDKKGKQVNVRGYLIDRAGHVVNSKGRRIFEKKELDANGEFPKLFKFTRFDENEVMGNLKLDERGELLFAPSEGVKLPKGVMLDEEGRRVN